jgi:hypothetical protein
VAYETGHVSVFNYDGTLPQVSVASISTSFFFFVLTVYLRTPSGLVNEVTLDKVKSNIENVNHE